MKGRKPKPTKLKILNGNPGKRQLNAAEPSVVGVPVCPEHLDPVARAEWERIVATLTAMNLIGAADQGRLAGMCLHYSRWVRAEEQLAVEGEILTGSNGGPFQNPLLAVANKAFEFFSKASVEFGMTPSARSRVTVNPEKPQSGKSRFFSAS